jgi:hypothetical protein
MYYYMIGAGCQVLPEYGEYAWLMEPRATDARKCLFIYAAKRRGAYGAVHFAASNSSGA